MNALAPPVRSPGFFGSIVLAVKAGLNAAGTAMRFPAYGGSTSSYGTFGRRRALTYLPGSAGYDFEAEAGPLWMNSAVAACIGWIRKNFPEPRLTVEVRRGTEWVEDPEHPILEQLSEPNPAYTDDVLWAATALSLVVDGNGYWLKARAPGGSRIHYWYLPHWTIFPCWPADGTKFISHYEQRIDGKTTPIAVDDIVHFRTGIDPLDERRGLSELKTCLREVCSDNEANTYTASILKHMGIVGVVIAPESATDEIGEEEGKALSAGFTERTGMGRGKPLVNSVALKITQLAMSPEKMTLDKIRRIPEARICATIGTPAMVVGLCVGDEGRTYANLGEANRHAYENCLMPMQKSMAKDLQRQSKGIMQGPRVERLVWRYDEVQALREDQSEIVKRVVIAVGGPIMTRNEGRSRVGLKPLAGPENDVIATAATPGDKPTIGGLSTETEPTQ